MEQPGPNVDGPLMGVRPGEADMCRISLTRPRLPPAAYKGQRPFFAKGEVQRSSAMAIYVASCA
jgi:hypothetical protein